MTNIVPIAAKHRQVYEAVHRRIQSGDYRPGERIPSEANLIEEFGVSRPTVARALQELERRGLVQRRRGSGTYVREVPKSGKQFGLVVPGIGDTEVFDPICGEMARLAQRSGHSLIWGPGIMAAHADEDANIDKGAIALELCQRFANDSVSGVFFAPLELIPEKDRINRQIIATFREAKIPVVLLDRDYVRYPGRSSYDLVGINNRRVGHTITDHMFAAGCTNLHFVLRPGSASTIHARAAGFTEAFLTRRRPFELDRIHECDPRDRVYVRSMFERFCPDGIVCGNDVTAGYLMHTLEDLGVRVPCDVMIGGIDDVKYAELLRVRLTTVRQPFAAIGDAAYHTMLDRIARPQAAPRHITLGCELVVRDSTRAVAEKNGAECGEK